VSHTRGQSSSSVSPASPSKDPSLNNCFDKPARMLQAGSIAGTYGGAYAGWDRCPGAAGGRGRGGASHGPPRPSPSARAICAHCVHLWLNNTTISARRGQSSGRCRSPPAQAGPRHGRGVRQHECNHKCTRMNTNALRFHLLRRVTDAGGETSPCHAKATAADASVLQDQPAARSARACHRMIRSLRQRSVLRVLVRHPRNL
jgi:hypothetical protein